MPLHNPQITTIKPKQSEERGPQSKSVTMECRLGVAVNGEEGTMAACLVLSSWEKSPSLAMQMPPHNCTHKSTESC